MLHDPKWDTQTALGVLIGARDLLADPAHWTKGCAARDRNGKEVKPTSKRIASMCVSMALSAAGRGESDARQQAYMILLNLVGPGHGFPGVWNDAAERTHADVMALFDRGISVAMSKADRT